MHRDGRLLQLGSPIMRIARLCSYQYTVIISSETRDIPVKLVDIFDILHIIDVQARMMR